MRATLRRASLPTRTATALLGFWYAVKFDAHLRVAMRRRLWRMQGKGTRRGAGVTSGCTGRPQRRLHPRPGLS